MKIESAKRGGELVLTLAGSVDQVGAKELKQHLDGLDLAGVDRVTVDFKNVSYIGSAGVGKLLLLYKNLPSHDTPMSLIGLSPDIMDLFKEMELGEIFSLNRKG